MVDSSQTLQSSALENAVICFKPQELSPILEYMHSICLIVYNSLAASPVSTLSSPPSPFGLVHNLDPWTDTARAARPRLLGPSAWLDSTRV